MPNGHVAEMQIAHKTLLVARAGLSGHAVYNRMRNAQELLERIGLPHGAEDRAQGVRELRENKGLSEEMANKMGLGASDLAAGGYAAGAAFRTYGAKYDTRANAHWKLFNTGLWRPINITTGEFLFDNDSLQIENSSWKSGTSYGAWFCSPGCYHSRQPSSEVGPPAGHWETRYDDAGFVLEFPPFTAHTSVDEYSGPKYAKRPFSMF